MWKRILTFTLVFTLFNLQVNVSHMGHLNIGIQHSMASGTGSGTGSGSGTGEPTGSQGSVNEDCGTAQTSVEEYGADGRPITANQQDAQGSCIDTGTDDGDGLGTWTQVGMYWNILVGLSGILAGIFWFKICTGQADVIVFTVASALAIVVEIIALITYYTGKDVGSERLHEIKINVSDHTKNAQIESLKAAIEETESAHSWATTREVFLYITAVVYIAAAIVAFVMGALGKTPAGAGQDVCKGGDTTSSEGYYVPPEKYKNNLLNPDEYFARTQVDYFGNKDQRLQTILTSSPYTSSFNQFSDFESKELSHYEEIVLPPFSWKEVEKSTLKGMEDIIDSSGKMLKIAVEIIIPQAHAAGAGGQLGAMLGIAVGVFILMWMISGLLKKIKGALQEGISRGVYMSIWAGLEFGVAAASTMNRQELGRIIDSYKDLKRQLEESSAVDGGTEDGGAEDDETNAGGGADGGNAADAGGNQSAEISQSLSGNCATGDMTQGSLQVGPDACGKTPPVTAGQPNYAPIQSVPGTGGAISTADGARREFNGVTSGTGGSNDFKNTNGNAGAFRKMDATRRKFLKAFRKQVKGFPSSKEVGDLRNKIQNKMKEAYNHAMKNASPDQLNAVAAELDRQSGKGGEATKQVEDYWSKRLASMRGNQAPAVNPFEQNKFGLDDVDFGDGDANLGIANDEGADYDKLNKYQLNENDIMKDPGVPIWKLISRRYKRSAFPRLFTTLNVPLLNKKAAKDAAKKEAAAKKAEEEKEKNKKKK